MWALLLSFVPACTGFRSGHSEPDPFTAENLVKGGLGIAGVVVLGGYDDVVIQAELAELMRNQIIDVRQDVKLGSAAYIERILGQENYHAMIGSYKTNRSLRPEVLADTSEQLDKRFGYIVFAGIDYDTISTRIEHAPSSTDYITHRSVVATFHVYDTKAVALVWTVNLDASADRTITRRTEAPTPGTLPSSLFPEAAALQEVTASLFEDFANKLPRTDPTKPDG
jgi:hypothetical protein